MQTVCTEAFCYLEEDGSEDEEEEEGPTSLGLSNLDSPALQVCSLVLTISSKMCTVHTVMFWLPPEGTSYSNALPSTQ